MKLTYLLTTADARAGTEKTFWDQARAMRSRGHDVSVVSMYRNPEPGFGPRDGIEVIYAAELEGPRGPSSLIIPTEWDNQFCAEADRALMACLANCDADVLITSTPALTVLALLACPDTLRIVEEEHRPSMARGVTAEPLLRHGPQVDAVVCLTQRNAEWLREKWGERAPRIEVIPNALPATGRPVSGGRQKVVMSAGRLVRSKGFTDLVRAFAQVADEFPEWRLRIFGDGPMRKDVLTTARNLGIAGRVELMPPTQDIETEWSRASIGALASRYEGLPLVLLEARGAGLPVVAYDCTTGPREIIENGKDGYLVPVGSISGFAASLRLLMGDDQRRGAMGRSSDESLRRFAPETVADQWEHLFAELLAAGEPARLRAAAPAASQGAPAEEEIGTKSVTNFTESAPEDEAPEGNVPVGPDDVLPHRARENNRAALEDLFAGSGVDSRPLRSGSGASWAVRQEDRERTLQHLVDHARELPGLEARIYAGAARLDEDGVSWLREPGSVDWTDVSQLYLFRHYEVARTGVHIGYAAGLTVEFWQEDERRQGLYRGRRRNDEVELLEPGQFDRPLFTPWSPMRGRPLWTAIEFPIDAVYTWVDGGDPRWLEKRAAVSGEVTTRSDLAAGEVRFLNRDELRYSLRSLHAHLPWVRHVYLVTDEQRPDWLVEDERLTVIDHREIFPDPSVLPVFNSHAIETALHRIPGLSEHFLYLNDDGFALREQSPQQYFTPTGMPRFFPSPTKINDLGEQAEPHEIAAMNNRDLIESRYGVTITQGMLHSPYPHRRSYLDELTAAYPEAVERTRAAHFRSSADISLVSSFAQHAGHLDGAYAMSGLKVAFVSLGAPDTAARLTRIRPGSVDYLTFGESGEDPDPEYTLELVTNYLANRFPIPSPWEQQSRGASSPKGTRR